MNEPKEKITSIKNSEDWKKLEAEYKEQIEKLEQKALDWENACIAESKEKLELKTSLEAQIKKERNEKEEWKTETLLNRKVRQEQQQTREEADFESEFAKLRQAKRGTNI